jgi:hypothetical protein
MIYFAIAEDSVNLKSPSIKYGKLGKSKPDFDLNENHYSGVL